MSKVFVIAEAGVNHNGSLDVALRLVDEAARAGADAVKFQTFKAEKLVSNGAEKAAYQKATTSEHEDQLEMIRRLELTREDHFSLVHRCSERGIEFMSTAFDSESIELLGKIGLKRWKIPSGEITNLPYLRQIGEMGVPLILSTSMATLGEVEKAIDVLEESGTPRSNIVILHCTTEYPAPIDEVNLRAMVRMGDSFGVSFGYSDHTAGIAIPIAAVALGAVVIEKHFTLDRNMEGPDHLASLEPDQLSAMIAGIREIELALGDGIKRPTPAELLNRPIARKSIVAARQIGRGEILSGESLTVKRPGNGISPMEWDNIIGRVASRDYKIDEIIEW